MRTREEANRIAREKYKIWATANPGKQNLKTRTFRANCRIRILQMYGGKCSTCGEPDGTVLQLDHIHGGGTQHRREVHSPGVIRDALLAENSSKYQLLCANCHVRKHRKDKQEQLKTE